ncbi:DUF2572 domain-containing protein [Hathewaya histolytica]|uniref:Protein of uncharacterized function (DUF2572) n=1 Tax=Hathewaya histolytica TaxID=1498 RepID=A0A4U9R7D6_HATHI|nr:DUF2572 family protein [Hathewaya histolytica]VTQ86678.1 Protein of uncharacterised function (DUF2572) [Hathewaya histolytica]
MNRVKLKKSKKGSSLIMVLVVTLLIITLGSVSLSMSLSNVRMSSKVKGYNEDYYNLEDFAANMLEDLDKKLKECEEQALDYFKKELYRQERSDTNVEPVSNFKNPSSNQKFIYSRWKNSVSKATIIPGTEIHNTQAYDEKFEKFFNEAFNRIYYSYAQKKLEGFKYPSEEEKVPNDMDLELTLRNSKDFSRVGENDDWDKMGLTSGDFKISFTIKGKEGKKLSGDVAIIPPHYNTLKKEQYKTLRPNPIWTNALVAGGTMRFESRSNYNIYGDVISMEENKKDTTGIYFGDRSKLRLHGNLITSNNIALYGDSHNITIDRTSGIITKAKEKVFNNNYGFDDQNRGIYPNFTNPRPHEIVEDSPNPYKKNSIPLLFDDIIGGNVYCNLFSTSTTNAKIQMRNIMVKDRVKVNGANNSVKINNLLIGTGSGTVECINDPYSTDINKLEVDGAYIADGKGDLKGFDESQSRHIYNMLSKPKQIDTNWFPTNTDEVKVLDNIINKKATTLGVGGTRSINSFVNDENLKTKQGQPIPEAASKIRYIKSNGTLELKNGEEINAIVYGEGSITISGNGSINGVIIAKGNITFKGNINVKYDETVIQNAIKESPYAQQLFAPGQRGSALTLRTDDQGNEVTYEKENLNNSKAIDRIQSKRYNIIKWNRK